MPPTYTGTETPAQPAADARLSSPSAGRNVGPILEVLRAHMPETGQALELASGTGEHVVAWAAAFPGVYWRPTDVELSRLASIDAWVRHRGLGNVAPAMALNAADLPWPVDGASIDAVFVSNLLHLVSDETAAALFKGARQALKPGGQLFVYGPFMRSGAFASSGDASFHATLRQQDPSIGYKDVDAIAGWATDNDFAIAARHTMPANNLTFVFRAA